MALPITVPFTFGNATTTQSLSSLDSDFSTVYNAVNGIGNGTVSLANVSITGGTISANITSSSISSGTSNVSITYTNGPVSINTNGTNAIYVDPSQNVGIGTLTPNRKLQVAGIIRSEASAGEGGQVELLNVTNNSVAAIFDVDASNNTRVWSLINNSLTFGTYGSERMRIDTSGNLLLGSTGAQAKLFVYGNGAGYDNGLFIAQGNTPGDLTYASSTFIKYDNDATTSQILLRFIINNGLNGQGQINANGANAAAFGSYSDERLKENIIDLPSQLANVCLLRPVEFDYKDGSGHQIGFVAQEMQTVYPDAVGNGSDDMLTVTGWSKTEARLVSAIKELSAKNDALEARLAALEAK